MRSLQHKGFTLMELLVVIALLAIVAAAAFASYAGYEKQAQADATRFEMAELRRMLLQFRRDVGHFPQQLSHLNNCPADEDPGCTAWNPDTRRGWNGPYVAAGSDAFKDGWGGEYVIASPGCDSAAGACWCKSDGIACQAEADAEHTLALPGNAARLLSRGSNGAYEGLNTDDVCRKNGDASDDLVLCLLR